MPRAPFSTKLSADRRSPDLPGISGLGNQALLQPRSGKDEMPKGNGDAEARRLPFAPDGYWSGKDEMPKGNGDSPICSASSSCRLASRERMRCRKAMETAQSGSSPPATFRRVGKG
ncbi:protein of unknown function [Methylacidimicrobium sp. AP8]|nr:protein of unknown function [Methylacidimicrobium sp. AP8]